MTKPNAFTMKPKIDPQWLKKLNQTEKNAIGGRKRSETVGGQIVPGMGTRDVEKTRISK